MSVADDRAPNERSILLLVAAVQFINICDFMMLAPLGPQLARSIGIPESSLPDATAAYTFAAGIAGIIGSTLLDRFDRRRALAVTMIGLVLGTAAGGLATGLWSLVAARMLAGAFGGPATSVSLAIIADVVPESRRGKAMGTVMGAFAAASVLGVPLGIAAADLGTWRTPLFALSIAGAVVTALVIALLPPLTGHQARASATRPPLFPAEMLKRPAVIASYTMTALANVGMFVLIPNISTYVQNNLGLPTHQLKYMYLAGGVVSFFTTRLTGNLVDRFGTLRIGTLGTLLQVIVVYVGFANAHLLPWDTHLLASNYALFMSFMFANGVRNVAYSTLTTRVPRPEERARFMSLQSSMQHLSASAGSSLSARLLGVTPTHALTGFDVVSWVCITFAITMPPLMRAVERRLREGKEAALAVQRIGA
ncbi:MAG: MFS transporter [Polyangiaceae bacterium]